MTYDLGPGEFGEIGAGFPVAVNPPVHPGPVELIEVPGGDPAPRLVRVCTACPPVGEIPHVVVQSDKHPAGNRHFGFNGD